MKKILSMVLLLAATFSYAELAELGPNEIKVIQALFERIEVVAESVGKDCAITTVDIQSRVKGFNPARWTVTYNDGYISTAEQELQKDEVKVMLNLVNDLGIISTKKDKLTSLINFSLYHKDCKNKHEWYVHY